ncbi:hypothetical protein MPF19_18870 [Polaribacter sp. Z014]|uniref:hypothetical protein n=1 Tax=Polaribacter sp. Z014 TaxID=2927126 RepID=UPI0020223102|nr:hypothetical protein [Polaribacter sp. Z014]MCL7765486.1 hypothetical protein [Polaribacter sp. Z014]
MEEKEKQLIVLIFIKENNFRLIDETKFLPKNIGFTEYLNIIEYLEGKKYVESIGNDNLFTITELGILNIELIQLKLKEEKYDKLAERTKLHNESIVSGWNRKTFWTVFIFGLLGGIYGFYDLFIKVPIVEKELKQIKLDILENKRTTKELRTLVLSRKNIDSLNHSNSELNNNSE